MTSQDMNLTQPKPTSIMVYINGFMLPGVLVYFGFTAVNSLGLKNQPATAQVISKGYRETGQTCTTQKVGSSVLTIPQSTPEMYLLEPKINGETTHSAVAKPIYDRLNAGDQVAVVSQRNRNPRGIQVVSVSP